MKGAAYPPADSPLERVQGRGEGGGLAASGLAARSVADARGDTDTEMNCAQHDNHTKLTSCYHMLSYVIRRVITPC